MRTYSTDVVVIGGGATGAGTLRDLAMRGVSAILLERADIAQGTSGRFHGLLHSGGRYVVSDPRSATECAEENELLRKIHPDAIEDTGGLFVVGPDDPDDFPNQFLAGATKTGVWAEEITVAEMLRREPRLNPQIKRAFAVRDASVDGWRMCWGAIESAKAYGAQALTYHRATKIEVSDGTVSGVRAIDEKTGEDVLITCHGVINAGGPWAGQIAALAGAHGVDVVPGRGIMVAMNHRLVNSVVNRCIYPADGDILVPAHTVSIIGTTDVAATVPDHLEIRPEEVEQMLDAGEVLVPGFRESRAVHVWAGARPLVKDTRVSATDTRHMSRGMSIIDHRERDGITGLFTIAGGKLTTYRLMAKNVTDALLEQMGNDAQCITHTEPVPNANPTLHKITDRLEEIEEERLADPLVCECELVRRSTVLDLLRRQPNSTIDDLRRQLRIGMGPCQGTFCTLRAAGILHEFRTGAGPVYSADAGHAASADGHVAGKVAATDPRAGTPETDDATSADDVGGRVAMRARAAEADRSTQMLELFIENRRHGIDPLLHGEQMREMALANWMFEGILDIGHLPEPSEKAKRATGDLATLATVKEDAQ
ncbi:glycerol-3-phosphate dehydrogenase [Arcanobacterium wilhelmae]|uniref:glycerol-3-phosphate dehydrogenase n=1 Tax=Arcanobacterium wilhelmae TaxID=1803177 RepID=A0ABT9NBI8_9ACTO|nr:anaerobic glycerol-3-phosphate dehydrogenase subunit GlpA [Arcanobacterium wilhelmae]MDP9800586.1 glycerol-3-phosphate dehydrogenase [Arcanobacterium wilhelmae]